MGSAPSGPLRPKNIPMLGRLGFVWPRPLLPLLKSGLFFEEGKVVRTVLPLGCGRCMHLVVVYGYQGASHDPDALANTGLLFDGVLEGAGCCCWGQLWLIVGVFNVQLNLIPFACRRGLGYSSWEGIWRDLQEVSWLYRWAWKGFCCVSSLL